MNGSLIFRYFVHNHRRTVTAIKILSIGIIAISGTIQMVNILSSQIDNFAVLPSSATANEITVTPDDIVFSTDQINKLNSVLDRYFVESFFYLSIFDVTVEQSNITYPLQMTIVNLTEYLPSFFPLYKRIEGIGLNNSGLYIDVQNSISLSTSGIHPENKITIKPDPGVIEDDIETVLFSSVNTEAFFGLLMDISKAPEDFQGFNRFIVRTAKDTVDAPLIDELLKIEGLTVTLSNGKDRFIQASAKQIVKVMYYLYLMISALSFMSIAILIKNIIDESEAEIRVMRSIGFTTGQIIILFAGQASLIGLIGAVFGILISFIFVNSAFSLLTVLGIGVFIPPEIYLGQGLQRIIESQLIALGASAIPIYNRFRRQS